MGLEDLTGPDKFLDAFVVTWPEGSDDLSTIDDHQRGTKNVLVNTFGALDRLYDLNLVSFWNDSATGAMYLPQGTTAQQPSAPVSGEWRFNTETGYLERWSGSAWQTPVAMTLQDNVYGLGTRQSFGRYVEAIRSGGGTGTPQPTIDAIRRGIVLAPGNMLGGYRFLGPDDAATPNEVVYGDISGRVRNTAEGAIDGEILLRAPVAGSLARRLTVGSGVAVGSSLDPLKEGDVNAASFSRSGVQVSAYESPETAMVAGQTLAFEHLLGGRAKLYQMYLVCKLAVGGYAIGDEIVYGGNGSRQGGAGGDTSFFSLWTEDATHIRLQVPDRNWHVAAKNTGTYFETGVANWNVVVRASGW